MEREVLKEELDWNWFLKDIDEGCPKKGEGYACQIRLSEEKWHCSGGP